MPDDDPILEIGEDDFEPAVPKKAETGPVIADMSVQGEDPGATDALETTEGQDTTGTEAPVADKQQVKSPEKLNSAPAGAPSKDELRDRRLDKLDKIDLMNERDDKIESALGKNSDKIDELNSEGNEHALKAAGLAVLAIIALFVSGPLALIFLGGAIWQGVKAGVSYGKANKLEGKNLRNAEAINEAYAEELGENKQPAALEQQAEQGAVRDDLKKMGEELLARNEEVGARDREVSAREAKMQELLEKNPEMAKALGEYHNPDPKSDANVGNKRSTPEPDARMADALSQSKNIDKKAEAKHDRQAASHIDAGDQGRGDAASDLQAAAAKEKEGK